MVEPAFLTLKAAVLSALGLPNIGYPVPSRLLPWLLTAGDELPLAFLLYCLQVHSTSTGDDWAVLEPAMDRLSVLLTVKEAPTGMIVVGEDWGMELGLVDLDGKIVTIQRDDQLIAAIAPRADGALRVATYRPLDTKSAQYLTDLARHPGPEGMAQRQDNWEYTVDASAAGARHYYAAERHESYLSYWEFGIGRFSDGATSEVYLPQRLLLHRPFARAASELGIHASLRGLAEELPPAEILGKAARLRFVAVPRGAKSPGRRARTSTTHPLQIAEVQPQGLAGRIGLTFCPGKVQVRALSGAWMRSLSTDLGAVRDWGATALLNLLTWQEMLALEVGNLPQAVHAAGLAYHHLQIKDGEIPDEAGERAWEQIGRELRGRIKAGQKILIHCKGGLGRTGIMAARLLVEFGTAPSEALRSIRHARPGAIESSRQEEYVRLQHPIPGDAYVPAWIPKRQQKRRVRARFLGCLLGGAVGDALGAPVEFLKVAEIRERFGVAGVRELAPAYGRVGAISDDTQMTLFTAEGLIRGHVRLCFKGTTTFSGVTAHAYLRWLQTQGEEPACSLPFGADEPGWLFQHQELHSRRAPGNTCLTALRAMQSLSQRAENDSKGCGGVMRVAPVGLFAWHWRKQNTPMDTFTLATRLAAITHGHPTGYLTAGVLGVLILALTDGASLPDALKTAKACLVCCPGHEETLETVIGAEKLAVGGLPHAEAIRILGQGWVAEEALAISIYCALVGKSFQDGVTLAVNHDGDSDSTGSITGNLLGALYGARAIPGRWLAALELREVIAELSDDLFEMPNWEIGEYAEDDALNRRLWEKYPGS